MAYPSAKTMTDELNRTAVLSESFKDRLISLMMKVMEEAYQAGKKAGKNDSL